MSNINGDNDDSIDLESNDTAAAPINDSLHARGHRQQQQLLRHQQMQQHQHHHHHLKAVSNLANGINRIAVNYNGSNTNNSIGNKHCETNDESGSSQMLRIRTNTKDGDDVSEMGVLRSEKDAVGAVAGGGDGGGMDAEKASAFADNSSSALLASRSTSHDYGTSVVATASGGGGGGGDRGNDGVKYQAMDALRPTESADDCDRSQQSSISGVSWDGTNNRGGCASASGSGNIGANKGVSSFRSRAGRKAYSPRWMDRKSGEEDGTRNHHHQQQQQQQHRNNHRYQHMMSSSSADGGYASLTEDSAVHLHQHHHHAAVDSASFSSGERKRTRNGSFSSRSDVAEEEARHQHHQLQQQHQHQQHHQEYFATSHAWSTTTRTDTNDSHDEGYLSSTAEGGYHSGGGSHSASVGVGGYHSFHHPELSFAASVKSDIATVCSGSVVEDIDMTEEIASVASDGRKGAALPHNTKGVEFASNILNDMGPPQALCSALLLAANAACRPSSSHCSLRSFDTNEGGAAPGSDAVSDVVAHLDTDDCCDRSIESEVSTLHSQDEMMSEEHKDGLDVSARSTDDMTSGAKGSLHHTSDPLLLPGRDRAGVDYNLPLQRFRQGVLQQSNGGLLEDGGQKSQYPEDEFTPWTPEFVGHGREDDWSNSRSHSRSPSRSLSPSSSRSRSRSRSRSSSRSPGQLSWYRGRDFQNSLSTRRTLRAKTDAEEKPPIEEMMEDGDFRVDFSSNPNL